MNFFRSVLLLMLMLMVSCSSFAQNNSSVISQKAQDSFFNFISPDVEKKFLQGSYLNIHRDIIYTSNKYEDLLWNLDVSVEEMFEQMFFHRTVPDLKWIHEDLDFLVKLINYSFAYNIRHGISSYYERETSIEDLDMVYIRFAEALMVLHNHLRIKSGGKYLVFPEYDKILDVENDSNLEMTKQNIKDLVLMPEDLFLFYEKYEGVIKFASKIDTVEDTEFSDNDQLLPILYYIGVKGTAYYASNIGYDIESLRLRTLSMSSVEYSQCLSNISYYKTRRQKLAYWHPLLR